MVCLELILRVCLVNTSHLYYIATPRAPDGNEAANVQSMAFEKRESWFPKNIPLPHPPTKREVLRVNKRKFPFIEEIQEGLHIGKRLEQPDPDGFRLKRNDDEGFRLKRNIDEGFRLKRNDDEGFRLKKNEKNPLDDLMVNIELYIVTRAII
jgi:hypothetical protein